MVCGSCERSLRILRFQLLYPRPPPPGFHKFRALGSLQFFLKHSLWNVHCSDAKMTCCTRETEILSTNYWPHPTLEHLFQTYWLIADKLFVKVSAQVSQQPSTYLDWNNNLKWKRVKYGDFPDQSQSFHILAHSSHRCKLHKAPKQTMSSLDWSGCKPSREPFIWVVNCVLHKSYSYEWFHSHFMQGFW